MSCKWQGLCGQRTYHIEVEAFADTGYDASGESEPDPIRLISPEKCSSELRLGLWRATAKKADWGTAWTVIEKQNWSDGNTHTAIVDGAKYRYRYVAINLVELGDENAVKGKLLEPIGAWIGGS